MPKLPPDEGSVYLAVRSHFAKCEKQITVKRIRHRLTKTSGSSEIAALLQKHTVESVADAVKKLVAQGVFESPLRAKLRFPELFDVSPTQTAKRAASESEAARREADALKEAAEHSSSTQAAQKVEDTADNRDASNREKQSPEEPPKTANSDPEILYPVYFSVKSQYKLLTEVQSLLEAACFAFASTTLPETVQLKGWECAESVELNVWAGVFKQHEPKFRAADKPLADLLQSVANLRHTAVHRLKTAASGVVQLLVDAEAFAALLGDGEAAAAVGRLRRRAQAARDDLERWKDLVGARIAATRREFVRRRTELAELEREAVAEMLGEDRRHQEAAGWEIEDGLVLELAPGHWRAVRAQREVLEMRQGSEDEGSSEGMDTEQSGSKECDEGIGDANSEADSGRPVDDMYVD